MSDYRTFDQAEKLGPPPWSGPALEAWEAAHGHDARLKCYPEFGCQIEAAETEAELVRLRKIEAAARTLIVRLDVGAVRWDEQFDALREALGETA